MNDAGEKRAVVDDVNPMPHQKQAGAVDHRLLVLVAEEVPAGSCVNTSLV